jgi:DHA1 family inner membrane transport protein
MAQELKSAAASRSLTRPEWYLLLVLAALQFVNIVDFMLVMPLGPQLMRVFSIGTPEFNLIVSAYTFSAALAGLVAALGIDRFDRKSALMTFFVGFIAGNVFCALAPTYEWLVAARVVTGAFGGLIGSMIFAVVADAVPEVRRGMAMGIVAAAFSVASVAGVPLGVYFGTKYGWHVPFFAIAAMSTIVLILGWRVLPPMTEHLKHPREHTPIVRLWLTLAERAHLRAFLLSTLLMISSFIIIPSISPYMVANVGLTEQQLPLIYVVGGALSLLSTPLVGRLSDRFGRHRIFAGTAVLSIVSIAVLTNLPRGPLWYGIGAVSLFIIANSARMTASMALITSTIQPHRRGGFMTLNSCVQHLAAGLASWLSAQIITGGNGTSLGHYNIAGAVSLVVTVISIGAAWMLRPIPSAAPAIEAQALAEATGV